MLNTSGTGCPTVEVFARERAIDPEGGAGTFRRGDDHQLDILDDVASGEHAGDAGRFVLPAPDAAVTRELTSKRLRKL